MPPADDLDAAISDIWSSDYVQKNPNKAYKASYASEYTQVAAYLNGGPRPNPTSFSKLGRGLVVSEDVRRGLVAEPEPEPEPEPQPGEPAPIAGQGYRKVFEDDFDTFNPAVWARGLWYEAPASAASLYASNGILHLKALRSEGYRGPNTCTSIAVGNSHSFRRGYFECRMRWSSGIPSWPAFWLFSTHWRETGDCSTLKISEFDIFEGAGFNPRYHNGTLHRNTSDACGQPDQINANHGYNDVGFALDTNWHVYSGLWTQSECRWYVDEKEIIRAPVWDSTDQDMFLVLTQAVHTGANAPNSSTPDELHTEVDWVRAWQKG